MQRYKQLPIIRYGSKKSMIKKDKKHVSKSTLLKIKIQASPNDRFGLKDNHISTFYNQAIVVDCNLRIGGFIEKKLLFSGSFSIK